MSRITSKQDARERMQKSVDCYAIRTEAWEKVKRLHKKDGGNFAILSKNFEGCKFVERYGSNYVEVYFKDENGAYSYDFINLERNDYTNTPAADDPDKVEARIAAVVEKYRALLVTDQLGLEKVEGQIDEITPLLDSLNAAIEAAKGVNTHYVLGDFIKGYLRLI